MRHGDVGAVAVLRFAEARTMTWRNGGGRTREIDLEPLAGDTSRFRWRISVAEVTAGGPFSAFPGIDRVLLFCDGPRMVLTMDGADLDLVRHRPVVFRGEQAVFCQVPGGPTRDLNVMTDRQTCSATVRVVDVAGEHRLSGVAVETAVAVVLGGALWVPGEADSAPRPLAAYDAVKVTGGAETELHGEGRVAIVEIGPTPSGSSPR